VEEKSREVKHEFVNGEIFAMAGGGRSSMRRSLRRLAGCSWRNSDRRQVEVWRRGEQGFSSATYGAGDEVRLDSIDFVLSVDELYDIAGVAPG
jgi:hypothetical protein